MQSSRVQASSHKLQFYLKQPTAGFVQQQIDHSGCSCELCVNNVKPIAQPPQVRQSYPNQINIKASSAFLYVLKKFVNYRGIMFIPQIIFFQQGIIFYTNQWGRIRMKDKLTNQQAKKYFDQRKQKTKTTSKNLQKQKDTYVLVYDSGQQQIMNEAFYGKILTKRKNDPFWLQAVYAYKMPQPKDYQTSLKTYFYQRTKNTVDYMLPIMQKTMKQIDSIEQRQSKQQFNKNLSTFLVQETMMSNFQPSVIYKNSNPQPINSSQMQMAKSVIQPQSIIFKGQAKSKTKSSQFSFKTLMQQLIAFLQISAKVRVLEMVAKYTQDVDGQPVLIHFQKLIVIQLKPNQQNYLHDRYKPLQPIGQKQLTELKKELDYQDEQQLWNVCIQILQSCLEKRKIKLKISDYCRPSKKMAKQIFIKFFPEFSPGKMFQNVNWKNQLPKFMSNTRQQINRIIQSDEGISVLKRFNITFYRTF